jgi:peptidoglycan/LPS O-acetylase OafA/YrhL
LVAQVVRFLFVLACLLAFNGPAQGGSHSALRQRTCVRCGWRAYLLYALHQHALRHPQMGVVSQSAKAHSILQRDFLYTLLARPVQ